MSIWQRLPARRLLTDVSLWSANLAALGTEINRIEPYTDLFHIDVSDDHFVPGLLFFPDLIAALRPFTMKPFHVHLMVERPLPLIDTLAHIGVDMITIHYEHGTIVPAALQRIRAYQKAAGLALNLGTEPEVVIPYLESIDLILLMGTELGVKGGDPAETIYGRIQTMRRIVEQHAEAERVKIGADGGIRHYTIPSMRAVGVDLIVPGSLVFKNDDDMSTLFHWLWTLPSPQG